MASGLSRLVERNALERMASFFGGGGRAREPAGTVRVVDPSPLNWLYITYNTVEELVRVDTRGKIRPAAMRSYRWKDARTLEVDVREGERFPDGSSRVFGRRITGLNLSQHPQDLTLPGGSADSPDKIGRAHV